MPADVDPATGYRRYRRDQLQMARAVAALRDLELSIAGDPGAARCGRSRHPGDDPPGRAPPARGPDRAPPARAPPAAHALDHRGPAGTLRRRPCGRKRRQPAAAASPTPPPEDLSVPTPPPPPTLDPETHRALAAGLFNRSWDLLEVEDRTARQDAELIDTAHASAWHWRQVGNAANEARGHWMLARVYSVLGHGAEALYHARCANEVLDLGGEGIEDWDRPAAAEAMARALVATGDLAAAAEWKARAGASSCRPFPTPRTAASWRATSPRCRSESTGRSSRATRASDPVAFGQPRGAPARCPPPPRPIAPPRSSSSTSRSATGATGRRPRWPRPRGRRGPLPRPCPRGGSASSSGPRDAARRRPLKMVNRLVEPTGGRILIDGVDTATVDLVALRRGIGYVIQQVGLFPHQTIADNVTTVPRLLGWPKTRLRERTDELLGLVGLDPARYRDRYPSQLSGGERQRVGVARALAADPPILLMDEPFGAVDPIVRDRLQNELLRLQDELAKTILFVTHDIDEAIKMGDLVVVMEQGGRRGPGRPAGGAARQPRLRVRRPLRRAGPRPEAPVAVPGRGARAARTPATARTDESVQVVGGAPVTPTSARCCCSTSSSGPSVGSGRPPPERRRVDRPWRSRSRPSSTGARRSRTRPRCCSVRTSRLGSSSIGRAAPGTAHVRPAVVAAMRAARRDRRARRTGATSRRSSRQPTGRLGRERASPPSTRLTRGLAGPSPTTSLILLATWQHVQLLIVADRGRVRDLARPGGHRAAAAGDGRSGHRGHRAALRDPSLAAFAVLRPILGLSIWTAIIPLTTYTLLILYRHIVAGFRSSRPTSGRPRRAWATRSGDACGTSSCRSPSRSSSRASASRP